MEYDSSAVCLTSNGRLPLKLRSDWLESLHRGGLFFGGLGTQTIENRVISTTTKNSSTWPGRSTGARAALFLRIFLKFISEIPGQVMKKPCQIARRNTGWMRIYVGILLFFVVSFLIIMFILYSVGVGSTVMSHSPSVKFSFPNNYHFSVFKNFKVFPVKYCNTSIIT